MHEWASRWLFKGDQPTLALVHNRCGSALRTELVCSACKQPLSVHNVQFDHRFSVSEL